MSEDIDFASDYTTPQEAYGAPEEAPEPEQTKAEAQPEETVEPALEAPQEEGAEVEDDDADLELLDDGEEDEAVDPSDPLQQKAVAKVDGEEIEVTFAEALKRYEHKEASMKRMEESAELRKLALEKLETAQSLEAQYQAKEDQLRSAINSVFGEGASPVAQLDFLQSQGVNLWDLVEKHIALNGMDVNQVAQRLGSIEIMTPAQRNLELERMRVEQMRADAETKAEAARREAQQLYNQTAQRELSESVDAALTAAGLPATAETRMELVSFLGKFVPKGDGHAKPVLTNALVHAAAKELAHSLPQRVTATLGGLDGEELLERLGPEAVKRIQKELVKKARKGRQSAKTKPVKIKGASSGARETQYLEDISFDYS